MNIKSIMQQVISREIDVLRRYSISSRESYIFYNLRRTDTTVELPLGVRWVDTLGNMLQIPINANTTLPKTALSILNNTIGARHEYLTNCKETYHEEAPILYKSVYGLITDPSETPLLEFTKKYNFVTNTVERYILRINKNFLRQENNVLAKYIKGSVIKLLSVESILGVDIDIIISPDCDRPLTHAVLPMPTREAHTEEIHRVLTSNLEAFTNAVIPE